MMKLIEEEYANENKLFPENAQLTIETEYLKSKLRKFKKSNLPNYENCYINQKMKSVVGLTIMYADTNQIVVSQKRKKKENVNPLIEELATVHRGIAMIFQKLDCEIKDSFNRPMEMSFAEYYKEDQQDFCEYRVPQLKITKENIEMMDELEQYCHRFREAIRKANKPLNFLCCRSNIFGMLFKNVFHSHDQTECLLEKNFDGRRFWIKTRDGTKLDSMFFPFNDEKVRTMDEIQEDNPFTDLEKNPMPDYLKYPTVIFFSPNAQCYQQQVHSPNCFWLKFFVTSNINVLAWNYRNYGRSNGTPDPYTCYHDAEAVLKFAIKDLGLQGKIGCFGRSLGGTMASHIAKSYP